MISMEKNRHGIPARLSIRIFVLFSSWLNVNALSRSVSFFTQALFGRLTGRESHPASRGGRSGRLMKVVSECCDGAYSI